MEESQLPNVTPVPGPVPPPRPSPGKRFLFFLRKVLLWSALLWALNYLFTWIGWDTWEKFSKSSTTIVNDFAHQSMGLSPMALWVSLKEEKYIQIDDPKAETIPAHVVREPSVYSFKETDERLVPAYHPKIAHKVTFKEKVIAYGRGFWYKSDGKPNWFGRIVLALAVILAFASGPPKNSSENSYWPVRLIQILLVLPFFLFALYLILKLLIFLVGAIVALFSSIMALGGFARYVAEELKSEAADHSKKTVLGIMLPFLYKKK